MRQDHENEIDDLMDSIVDDLKESMEEEGPSRGRSSHENPGRGKALIIWGVSILILVVLVLLFAGGGDKPSKERLNALESKVEALDRKLTRFEQLADKMALLEEEQKGLRQSVSERDGATKALAKRVEDLNRKVDALHRRPAVPDTHKQGEKGTPEKKASSAQKRYHEVRKGDTLYSIAKKYGISLNDLIRLNSGLAKNQVIQPGQKIMVSTGTQR